MHGNISVWQQTINSVLSVCIDINKSNVSISPPSGMMAATSSVAGAAQRKQLARMWQKSWRQRSMVGVWRKKKKASA